jgi:hypothetical protein
VAELLQVSVERVVRARAGGLRAAGRSPPAPRVRRLRHRARRGRRRSAAAVPVRRLRHGHEGRRAVHDDEHGRGVRGGRRIAWQPRPTNALAQGDRRPHLALRARAGPGRHTVQRDVGHHAGAGAAARFSGCAAHPRSASSAR